MAKMQVYLSKDELEALRKAAVRSGCSVADLIRDAIRKAVILGANEVEPDNDLVFFEKLLGEPDGYRYTALLREVRGSKAPPDVQRMKDKTRRQE